MMVTKSDQCPRSLTTTPNSSYVSPAWHRPPNLVIVVVVVVNWQEEVGEEVGQSIVLLSVQQHLAHTGNITTFHFSHLCASACFEKEV